MRKSTIFVLIIILFFVCEINAQNSKQSNEERKLSAIEGVRPVTGSKVPLHYPEIPRVSVFEAYNVYKAGKAIIFHAGGEAWDRRHIWGAFNWDMRDDLKEKMLSRFPKNRMEIFTYCY